MSANHVQNGREGAASILLVCPNKGMSAELATALAAELPDATLVASGDYPSRGEATHLAAAAEVCLVDMTSAPDSAAGLLTWLGAVAPQLPVIALLRTNDPDLILRCLRGGADDFLIQPFTSEQVQAVLAKLTRLRSSQAGSQEQGGKVICVVPGKGACGATTIACNLAFALRRMSQRPRVLLADLDGLTGTVAFVLKLKSTYSFLDAVTHSGALDQDVWKVLVTASRGVDVLLSPESPVDCYTEHFDPTELVGSSRRTYDFAVFDTGGAHGDWNEALARMSDEILLVTTNELPALHATQRVLAHLERSGLSRSKPRLVVNRYLPRTGLPEQAIGKALGMGVFASLPSDYEEIQRALMDGQAVAPATSFGRAVTSLARALTGEAKEARKSPAFGWLRGLF